MDEMLNGSWHGPGSSGEVSFPLSQILLLAAIVFVAALIIGGLARWKQAQIETGLQKVFASFGLVAGKHPNKFTVTSFMIVAICSAGIAWQETELDPSNLWVPTSAASVKHGEYADLYWPGRAAPSQFLIVPDDRKLGANMLTPERLRAHMRDLRRVMLLSVNGDTLAELNTGSQLYGKWTYAGFGGTRRKCFLTANNMCAMRSVLAVFGYDQTAISTITPHGITNAIFAWEKAPLNTIVPELRVFKSFEIAEVLGGIHRDSLGQITSAEVLRWDLLSNQTRISAILSPGSTARFIDPVHTIWEAEAACILGIVDTHPEKKSTTCVPPTGLKYVGQLRRSFEDEFGNAIQDDVRLILIAYVLIAIYLAANLGKRDVVHSMCTMAIVGLVVVGAAITSSSGVGGFARVKTNALNQNIPFLILGLGVDDAFVLAAEYLRHTTESPDISVADRISRTAQTGGTSVLITSLTDALAFLIGSTTSLPGLSAFCLYAGLGVVACFLLQLTLFLPLLALNAKRVEATRLDVLCCVKSVVDHPLEHPKGWCACIPGCSKLEPRDGVFKRWLNTFGRLMIKTLWGKLLTFTVFLCIFGVGFIGFRGLRKDFDISWFFPSASYVVQYQSLAQRYFQDGVAVDIFTNGVDMFERKEDMLKLSSYLRKQNFIVQGSITDWWATFTRDRDLSQMNSTAFWKDLGLWYQSDITGGGAALQGNIQWKDKNCQMLTLTIEMCVPHAGIAHSRIGATLIRLSNGRQRYEVLSKMREDIQNIFSDASGKLVFPFSFEFLFWEEYGFIDIELTRNLIIAAGVVLAIICLLLPKLRLAFLVASTICVSIFEVMGFMSLWGVTLNSVSTVYILICVGLSVDYSAHLAHAFRHSTGTSEDKALAALNRIGPSVGHALLSTAIAVSVLAFTETYVVRVFFKILMLVTAIAGGHGMWMLPVLLALLGGSGTTKELAKGTESTGHGQQCSPTTIGKCEHELMKKCGSYIEPD